MVKYNEVKKIFEKECCTLLTTEKEMLEYNLQTTSKYKIIASCGHEVNGCWLHMFKSRGTGKICKPCMDLKQSVQNKALNDKHVGQTSYSITIEEQGITILKKYIDNKLCFEKSPEGCLAEIAIKDIKNKHNKWMPIKIKCTSVQHNNIYSFGLRGITYKDMYLLLISTNDEKFWLVNGNDIANQKKISIGMKKSKYDKDEVKSTDLVFKLLEYYNNNINLQKLSKIQTPITQNCQKEQNFRKLREEKLKDIPFIQPELSHTVYDFTVNNFKVQEKLAFIKKNAFYALVHKNFKGQKNQPYKENDNDFYWINFPDKKNFYVFPEKIMIEKSIITNKDDIIGNKCISFSRKNTWVNNYKYSYDDNDICEKISQLFIN